VPALWPLEVANAAIVGERRKRLDEARTQRFIVLLEALPITLIAELYRAALVGLIARAEVTSRASATRF